jgi:hypothetical protein
MAITPNTNFVDATALTATQLNNFPRGIMAKATSTTTYNLTTSAAIATGMTVTFTAVANRNYRVTYYEPQTQTATGLGSFTLQDIRLNNAAGTQLQFGIFQSTAANSGQNGSMSVIYVGTFTAGSVTLVGCGSCTSTNGTPGFARSATNPAQLTVEDIGTA